MPATADTYLAAGCIILRDVERSALQQRAAATSHRSLHENQHPHAAAEIDDPHGRESPDAERASSHDPLRPPISHAHRAALSHPQRAEISYADRAKVSYPHGAKVGDTQRASLIDAQRATVHHAHALELEVQHPDAAS